MQEKNINNYILCSKCQTNPCICKGRGEENIIEKHSCFIECPDCQNVTLNEDDNVCLSCGSKNTRRLFIEDPIFKKTY